MSAPPSNAIPADVVAHLRGDHEMVKELLGVFDRIGRDEWRGHFRDLVRFLVAHEVAEEEVIFPVVRKQSEEAAALADECISEQAGAERRLDKMERLEPDTSEFADELGVLRVEVLEHAAHEERSIFPLIERLTEQDREMLGRRYERARSMAPTHPHPQAPDSPPGDVALGPIVAIADRIRDAIHREP